jgi:hypothetical protein
VRNLAVGWVIAAFSLGGCNCLQPVLEGSSDAGLDAGRDAGPPPQCTTAAQCTAFLPQSLCSFSSDAGFSCIEQRCVFECTQGRSCAFDAGASCLDCTVPAVTACVSTGCGAATMQGQIESVSPGCQPGFTDVMLVPRGGCQWTVTDATGTKGTMTHLGSGQYVGQFQGLGTCVGVSLFTQVERVLFS